MKKLLPILMLLCASAGFAETPPAGSFPKSIPPSAGMLTQGATFYLVGDIKVYSSTASANASVIITKAGLVDGRDVSADGSILDAVVLSTGTQAVEIAALKVNVILSTGAIQSSLNSVILSTGSLQTQINAISVATGTISSIYLTQSSATATYFNKLSNLAAAQVSAGSLGGSVIASSIAVAAVGIPQLKATGTPSAATYLAGDGSWGTPTGSGDMVQSQINNYVAIVNTSTVQTIDGYKNFTNLNASSATITNLTVSTITATTILLQTTTIYYSIPAASFIPIANTPNWDMNQYDLRQTQFTLANSFRAAVNLPNGATITEIKAYWGQSDAANSSVCKLYYRPTSNGNSVEMANISPDTGIGDPLVITDSTITNPVVNNKDNGYDIFLQLWCNNNITDCWFYGLRIQYYITSLLP